MQKTVLITGASSGLGQVMAGLLAQRGFSVWGTSRKTGQDMSDSDCKMLPMDLQDADSIKAAVKRIKETEVQSRFPHGKIFCIFKKDTARFLFTVGKQDIQIFDKTASIPSFRLREVSPPPPEQMRLSPDSLGFHQTAQTETIALLNTPIVFSLIY